MFDNSIFDINAPLDDERANGMLLAVLKLAFQQKGHVVAAYRKSKTKGLILDWSDSAEGSVKFPTKMNADQVLPIVEAYLSSDEAMEVELSGLEHDADHDGHNGPGFRVYTEEWGKVEGDQSICAIKRVFVWYGK